MARTSKIIHLKLSFRTNSWYCGCDCYKVEIFLPAAHFLYLPYAKRKRYALVRDRTIKTEVVRPNGRRRMQREIARDILFSSNLAVYQRRRERCDRNDRRALFMWLDVRFLRRYSTAKAAQTTTKLFENVAGRDASNVAPSRRARAPLTGHRLYRLQIAVWASSHRHLFMKYKKKIIDSKQLTFKSSGSSTSNWTRSEFNCLSWKKYKRKYKI